MTDAGRHGRRPLPQADGRSIPPGLEALADGPSVPRLHLRTASGLWLPDLDSTRIEVSEGSLLHTVRGATTVLAHPGEVTRLSVADVPLRTARRVRPLALRGFLLVWSGERLLTAVNLSEVWDSSDGRDDPERRAVSGVDALARSLGLVVEAATPAEIRRARRLRQRDVAALHDVAVHPRLRAPLSALAAMITFVPTMIVVGSGRADAAAHVAMAVALLVAATVGLRHRAVRARLIDLVGASTDPVVELVGTTVRARLAGTEHRIAAVDRALRTPSGIVLLDRRRRVLATLLHATSPDGEHGVLASLADAGVAVEEGALDHGAPGAYLWTPGLRDPLWVDDDAVTGGAATAGVLLSLGMLGTSALVVAAAGWPTGLWAPVAALAVATPVLRTERAWARWRRGVRSAARSTTP